MTTICLDFIRPCVEEQATFVQQIDKLTKQAKFHLNMNYYGIK